MKETGLDGGTEEIFCDVVVNLVILCLYARAADGRREAARAGEQLRELLAAAWARTSVAEAAAGFRRGALRPLQKRLGVADLATSGDGWGPGRDGRSSPFMIASR